MATAECDVIVVGAGLSGLSCAKWLRKYDIDVVVLEARDRVGGRTWTVKNPKVKYVDLGGSYVGPTQNHLLRMAKELGVETYKVDETKDLVYYRKGKSYRYGANDFPPMTFLEQLDVNNLHRTIDRMGEEIPAEAPWEAKHAKEWDRMTVKEFFDNTCYTRAGYELATLYINLIMLAEAWESSLLWFLWYIKVCGGIKRDMATGNGGQERKFVGGSMQISEKIVEVIGAERVKLNQAVHQLTQSSTTGKVTLRTVKGGRFVAKYVIFAMPPGVQSKIHYSPELPPLRNQLNQRMPVGTVMKCILYYEKAFWKEKGFCGSTFMLEPSDEFPIPYALDDTKPDGTFPAIIGFILCDKLRRLQSELTREERMRRLAGNYAKVFGCPEMLKPIHYEEKNWCEEEYSGGGYASIMPPGFVTSHAKALREPIGNLYFAGSETAIAWSCYMTGAISAGERAAREVLCAMGKIRKDQIWQEEPVSEDVPELPFEDSLFEKYAPSARCVMRIVRVAEVTAILLGSCWLIRKYDLKLSNIPSKLSLK